MHRHSIWSRCGFAWITGALSLASRSSSRRLPRLDRLGHHRHDSRPARWFDPLGPILKIDPIMVLISMALAIHEERR
jgi:hypothetical protein